MNKTHITTILAFVLASCIISCKEKEHDHPATESVNINIRTPAAFSEYDPGDTVWMDIGINAPANLHGYELHLVRLADTTEVFSFDEDVHEKDINILKYWINDGHVHSDMELQVVAHIDHSGNKAEKKVRFHCHEH